MHLQIAQGIDTSTTLCGSGYPAVVQIQAQRGNDEEENREPDRERIFGACRNGITTHIPVSSIGDYLRYSRLPVAYFDQTSAATA